MKIGIFGGTFNPIHQGHLLIAQAMLIKFGLDKVVFVPCHLPYHKSITSARRRIGLASPLHRLRMLREAIACHKRFIVSDVDIKRGGISYSIDTLRDLKSRYPKNTRFYFIIGADSLQELPLWYKIKELSRLCQFVTVARPGYQIRDFKRITKLLGNKTARLIRKNYLAEPLIDISSSEIRQWIRQKKSVKYLVPEPVNKYIIRHKLYKEH